MSNLERCVEQPFALYRQSALSTVEFHVPKTDNAGAFALTVNDIPVKYQGCASTTESPFIFEGAQDEGHRAVCSEVGEFGAKDECRKVTLKFEAQ